MFLAGSIKSLNAKLRQRFAPPPLVPESAANSGWVEVGSVNPLDKEIVVEDKQVQTDTECLKTECVVRREVSVVNDDEEDGIVREVDECAKIYKEVSKKNFLIPSDRVIILINI